MRPTEDAAAYERYLRGRYHWNKRNVQDLAFAWLDKAYDERANRLAYLSVEPTRDRLRADPRFDSLLRRIGLPP